jgi:hypothetical protein
MIGRSLRIIYTEKYPLTNTFLQGIIARQNLTWRIDWSKQPWQILNLQKNVLYSLKKAASTMLVCAQ